MRIYAILAILLIVVGMFSYVASSAVERAENKALRISNKEIRKSTERVLNASQKEAARHKEVSKTLQAEIRSLEDEASDLRESIPQEGEPVMCRPGCLVEL